MLPMQDSSVGSHDTNGIWAVIYWVIIGGHCKLQPVSEPELNKNLDYVSPLPPCMTKKMLHKPELKVESLYCMKYRSNLNLERALRHVQHVL